MLLRKKKDSRAFISQSLHFSQAFGKPLRRERDSSNKKITTDVFSCPIDWADLPKLLAWQQGLSLN